MISDVLNDLNRTAKEIRIAGHNGWGNACEQAADELALMVAKIEWLRSLLRELVAAHDMSEMPSREIIDAAREGGK